MTKIQEAKKALDNSTNKFEITSVIYLFDHLLPDVATKSLFSLSQVIQSVAITKTTIVVIITEPRIGSIEY